MKHSNLIASLTAAGVTFFAGGALAAPIVIDSFDSGDVVVTDNNGSADFATHSDLGILGGTRSLRVRDGHSGTINSPTALTVDAGGGTLRAWGFGTAPEQSVTYGSAVGAALNLSLSQDDVLEIDVDSFVGSDFVMVLLFSDASPATPYAFTSAAGTALTVGTNAFALSSFTGITDAFAADIDGIEFRFGVSGQSTTGGIVVSELRFEQSAAAVPTPATASLLLLGLAAASASRKRKAA